ncbi:helix-turn-helix transcriptional regulator [Desertimonas flava]|uniref:helix-turn-helix transcriptional regulator n=1 Tax=Desertimonas flava TaxID=2064846 RepID=UPI0013C50C6D|nr:helix-turn-helix domain-containing protein [Desertimonas flava]
MSPDRRQRDGRLSEQARALGDPTRFAVFRYIDESTLPVGVAELTRHFGLNHNAIRQHLAKLRDAGLVVEESNAPRGPGRPSLSYRPTPGAAERWEGNGAYQRLASLLIDVLGGASIHDVGYAAGRELARSLSGDVPAADALETITRRLGFEPRRATGDGDGDGVTIVLDHCPFASLAEHAPHVVCELHRSLAAGIADGTAADMAVTGLEIRPPALAGCRVQLTAV